ncbi:MAG TPA: hypothetical protein VGI75_09225, partial [Pirellulales bacterium]
YLSALVAHRGFRVYETYIEHAPGVSRLQDVRPNPADLLSTWWHCRRWRPIESHEWTAGQEAEVGLRVVGADGIAANIERQATANRRNLSPTGAVPASSGATVISIAQSKTA